MNVRGTTEGRRLSCEPWGLCRRTVRH